MGFRPIFWCVSCFYSIKISMEPLSAAPFSSPKCYAAGGIEHFAGVGKMIPQYSAAGENCPTESFWGLRPPARWAGPPSACRLGGSRRTRLIGGVEPGGALRSLPVAVRLFSVGRSLRALPYL